METTEKVNEFRKAMIDTRSAWLNYIKGEVLEAGMLRLKDNNAEDEDDSVKVDIADSDNAYVLHPSFDAVKVVKTNFGNEFSFRAHNGDDYCNDGEWISSDRLAYDVVDTLLDYIDWSSKEIPSAASDSDDKLFNAVRKYVYFTSNWTQEFIKQVWGDNPLAWHLADKFGDAKDFNEFYRELSPGNQRVLTEWILENYEG